VTQICQLVESDAVGNDSTFLLEEGSAEVAFVLQPLRFVLGIEQILSFKKSSGSGLSTFKTLPAGTLPLWRTKDDCIFGAIADWLFSFA